MRSRPRNVRHCLVRIPCSRCGRASAFVADTSLCPTCRAADLEKVHGLRPGLLRELATAADPQVALTRRRLRSCGSSRLRAVSW